MSNCSTRIRYVEVSPEVFVSRRLFVTGVGQEVKVELNLVSKKFRILDSVSGEEVVAGGNTRNSSVLKIQSKKALAALGVVFAEELRERGNSEDNGSRQTS